MAAWVSMPAPSVALVEDLWLPETGTRPAPAIRRFVPKTADLKPLSRSLVYFHGGGWVVGTLDGYAGLCSRLANSLHVQVFCVDYRLSPEVVYPVANEDCQAAFELLVSRMADLGLDPMQIMVCGHSAGGHPAITLSRWLKRDQALQASGARTSYQCVPGMLHGFIRFDAFCPESQQTPDWIADQI
jgi:acetyl esterase/lipase